MRKSILLTFYLICSVLIYATEQIPDYLYFRDKKLTLQTGWAYPSPLQTYFSQNDIEYPFKGYSTANYRGHIASWEIKNNKLYLKEIKVQQTSFKPEKFNIQSKSDSISINGEVFADWYSGVLACHSNESYFFHIRNGVVLNNQIVSKKDYKRIKKISVKDTSNHDLMNKYLILLLNENYISYYFRLSKEDSLVIENKGGYLTSPYGYSPILEYYSNDHLKWPYNWENFEKNGAPNCKWIINDNKIFLTQINLYSGTSFFEITTNQVNLETIFKEKVQNNRVFGDWISGIYIVKIGKENEDDIFPAYKKFTSTEHIHLKIENGLVIEKQTIPCTMPKSDMPDFNKMEEKLKELEDSE